MIWKGETEKKNLVEGAQNEQRQEYSGERSTINKQGQKQEEMKRKIKEFLKPDRWNVTENKAKEPWPGSSIGQSVIPIHQSYIQV